MFGRGEADVVGCSGRVGQAMIVRVDQAIVSVCELIGCSHAEQSGRAVERIGCWGSQGDAGRDVCEERGYEGGVGRVFEERFVGRTFVGGFGVLNYRKKGGVEFVEKVDDERGVSLAIDNTVLAGHHHVEIS